MLFIIKHSLEPSSPPQPKRASYTYELGYTILLGFEGYRTGETKLHINPDYTIYIDAPRRTSVHIIRKIKSQLIKMVSHGIITKVYHHTDWDSSASHVRKKNNTTPVNGEHWGGNPEKYGNRNSVNLINIKILANEEWDSQPFCVSALYEG